MCVLLEFWQKNMGDLYYETLPWFMIINGEISVLSEYMYCFLFLLVDLYSLQRTTRGFLRWFLGVSSSVSCQ